MNTRWKNKNKKSNEVEQQEIVKKIYIYIFVHIHRGSKLGSKKKLQDVVKYPMLTNTWRHLYQKLVCMYLYMSTYTGNNTISTIEISIFTYKFQNTYTYA